MLMKITQARNFATRHNPVADPTRKIRRSNDPSCLLFFVTAQESVEWSDKQPGDHSGHPNPGYSYCSDMDWLCCW